MLKKLGLSFDFVGALMFGFGAVMSNLFIGTTTASEEKKEMTSRPFLIILLRKLHQS